MQAVVPSFCHSPSRNCLTPASHVGVSVSCGCRNKTAVCFWALIWRLLSGGVRWGRGSGGQLAFRHSFWMWFSAQLLRQLFPSQCLSLWVFVKWSDLLHSLLLPFLVLTGSTSSDFGNLDTFPSSKMSRHCSLIYLLKCFYVCMYVFGCARS